MLINFLLNWVFQKIKWMHSDLPKHCVSPNVIVDKNNPEYPGMSGTGFIASWGGKFFYITALHCLDDRNEFDANDYAKKLYTPIRLEGKFERLSDYLDFVEIISSKRISNELIDILIFSISDQKNPEDKEHLSSRAVNLPPDGEYLDKFIKNPSTVDYFNKSGTISLTVIGYPKCSNSNIDYENGIKIHTQAGVFSGDLADSNDPEELMLKKITWQGSLDGFSGSPVFLGFKENDHQYYLFAGMVITGTSSSGIVRFIKASFIVKMITESKANKT